MSSSTPEIAIAFVVREKFGWALPSLQRLYRYIDQEFTLYFVDCGYPAAVRRQIGDFFRDKNNVVEIRATRYLLPNESLKSIFASFRTTCSLSHASWTSFCRLSKSVSARLCGQ